MLVPARGSLARTSAHRPRVRIWAAAVCAVLLAMPAVAGAKPPAPAPRSAPSAAHPTQHACSTASKAGYAACFAVRRTDVTPHAAPLASPLGYGPADVQGAYDLPSGSGQTVAIVDAYDDPNAESDLAVYRAQYGLAACTTDNGCFRKVSQRGDSNYPIPRGDWSQEISLDLDMVSAACPACHILLVEADDNSIDEPRPGRRRGDRPRREVRLEQLRGTRGPRRDVLGHAVLPASRRGDHRQHR